MLTKDLMTKAPACCTPSDTARDAARVMQENDCGSVPIVDDRESNRIVGVVTDRDLAMRGIAMGRGPDTPLSELMTPDPECCKADDNIDVVARTMTDRQLRRVIIVDGDRRCVGIVAQADIALAGESIGTGDVARIVESISEPASERGDRNRASDSAPPR